MAGSSSVARENTVGFEQNKASRYRPMENSANKTPYELSNDLGAMEANHFFNNFAVTDDDLICGVNDYDMRR
jgi:hypothetical protein